MVKMKDEVTVPEDIGFARSSESEKDEGVHCPQYRVRPGEIPGYKGIQATLRRIE